MREDEANVNHASAATEVAAHSTAAASVMSVNEPNEVATPSQIETGTMVNKDGLALACRQWYKSSYHASNYSHSLHLPDLLSKHSMIIDSS